jgi:hypothetical protein
MQPSLRDGWNAVADFLTVHTKAFCSSFHNKQEKKSAGVKWNAKEAAASNQSGESVRRLLPHNRRCFAPEDKYTRQFSA